MKSYYSIEEAQASQEPVTRLWLTRKVHGAILDAVFEFEDLTYLILDYNPGIVIPPQIALLKNLEGITLDKCRLREFPEALLRLPHLKSLSLTDNQLSALPPDISAMHGLQRSYLSKNRLTSLPPEIGALHNLEDLILRGNQLTALQIGRAHV